MKRFEDHVNNQLKRGDSIAAGLTITEGRAADVDFSISTSKPLNEMRL